MSIKAAAGLLTLGNKKREEKRRRGGKKGKKEDLGNPLLESKRGAPSSMGNFVRRDGVCGMGGKKIAPTK